MKNDFTEFKKINIPISYNYLTDLTNTYYTINTSLKIKTFTLSNLSNKWDILYSVNISHVNSYDNICGNIAIYRTDNNTIIPNSSINIYNTYVNNTILTKRIIINITDFNDTDSYYLEARINDNDFNYRIYNDNTYITYIQII